MTIEFGGPEVEAGGTNGGGRLRLPLEVLGRENAERLFPQSRPCGEREGVALFESEGLLLGWTRQPAGNSLGASAHDAYRRILRASAGWSLCRVWNYVPAINDLGGGLENYQAFNTGRAAGYAEILGPGYKHALPAGSAVGCGGSSIGIVFAATRTAPRYFENPEQIPAYEYPREHGPQAPSFSRATSASGGGRLLVFVSGTAAIKGHETVAPGSFDDQVACTLDNLRLISRQAGVGDDLGAGARFVRHFKVYLRRAEEWEAAKKQLDGTLLREGDSVIWLRTDLCRAELRIEIEATLIGA